MSESIAHPATEYSANLGAPPGPAPGGGVGSRPRSNVRMLRILDALTYGSAVGGALLMVGLLLLLLGVLLVGALPSIHALGTSFLYRNVWSPNKRVFGALPVIYGTLVTSGIALVISVPVSLGCSIFLTKLAPKIRFPMPRLKAVDGHRFAWVAPRQFVTVTSFLIELLAAIPSIAYGLWGVFVLVPFMGNFVQPHIDATVGQWPVIGPFFADSGSGYNIMTAGIVLSIMVIPIMTAIIRDVLAVAPPELEQGAFGLGATWWQATKLVLGYSKLGILGAVILGFARAVGETMAVTMVIGNSMDMDRSLFSPGYTIASLLANQFAEADSDALRHALIYSAFVLLVITTVINGIARIMVMRVAAKARRR